MTDLPIVSMREFSLDELCDYSLGAEIEVAFKRRLEDVINIINRGQTVIGTAYKFLEAPNGDRPMRAELFTEPWYGIEGEDKTWEGTDRTARISARAAFDINDDGYFISFYAKPVAKNFVQVAISVTKSTRGNSNIQMPDTAPYRRFSFRKREFVVEKC